MSYKISPFQFSYSKKHKTGKLTLSETIVFDKNEMIAIVGPSGSGKSTFLKMLKGIIPEYSGGLLKGEILYDDLPLTGDHFRTNLKNILYLFQNPYSQLIYPDVEEEFLFSMENFNFTKEEMEKKGSELNAIFNLNNLWGKKTKNLSNGECQKLVLSSLLAIGPKVLLLDEPTAFMDPETRKEFYAHLEKIKQDRLIIIVDHHLVEIKNMVDRYVTIDEKGNILNSLKEEVFQIEEVKTIALPSFSNFKRLDFYIESLVFGYEKEKELFKIDHLHIKGGEVVVVKGKNGVGKSTLFKLITGILKPTKGTLSLVVDSHEKISLKKMFKEIGMVFQNPENHFFFDTIKEELLTSVKNEKLENVVSLLFDDLDLEKSPFLLSEGEKRRLSLLMTLFLERKIILYDEPTFGQDAKSIHNIQGIVKEIKKQGIIQIIISHDEQFISNVADRVLMLSEGRLNEI